MRERKACAGSAVVEVDAMIGLGEHGVEVKKEMIVGTDRRLGRKKNVDGERRMGRGRDR